MESVIMLLMSGLLLGCTYTLIAIGFSLFFGVLDVVVFCSGDIAIFGAFAVMGSYAIIATTGLASLPTAIVLILVILVAAILCAILGLLTYALAIKPFENASPLMPLLTTIALGIVIREGLGLFYPKGRNPQAFPQLLSDRTFADVNMLSFRNIFIIAITVVILLLLFVFLKKTKMGISMQAIAQNKELAYMSGININRTILFTFIMGGALLSIGGFLIGSYTGTLRFDAGSMYGIKGFSAAVVGGLRDIYGAVIGGMLLGFIETLWSFFFSAAWANVIAFLFVVVFMVFKPEGIIGEKTVEKV